MIVENKSIVDLKKLIIDMTDLGEKEYRAIASYIFTFTGAESVYVDAGYISDEVDNDLLEVELDLMDMCQEVTYAIEQELELDLSNVIFKLDLNYRFN